MGRKSTVDKLNPDVRQHIERRLRENRLTLDELIEDLRSTFPSAEHPSRSALGRYRQNFEVMMQSMREQETMARILVEELGENPDDKAGGLMVQSLTTLVNRAVFQAQSDDDVDIEEVRKLARAAKDAIQARRLSLEERREIRRDALTSAADSAEEAAKEQGLSPTGVSALREAIMGAM